MPVSMPDCIKNKNSLQATPQQNFSSIWKLFRLKMPEKQSNSNTIYTYNYLFDFFILFNLQRAFITPHSNLSKWYYQNW